MFTKSSTIKKLSLILSREEKKSLFINVLLSIGVSAVEAFALSSLVIFIGIASNIDGIGESKLYLICLKYINDISPISFLKLMAVLLIAYYLIRAFVNLFYAYRMAKFSEDVYANLSLRLFEIYLKTNYINFMTRGPVFINKVLVSDAYNFTHIISASLIFLSEFFLLVVVIGLLASTNLFATISILFFISLSGYFVKQIITKRIGGYGVIRDSSQSQYYEFISTIFRNFKYFKVTPVGHEFLAQYSDNLRKYTGANMFAVTLSQVPRVSLEFLGFTTIIILFIITLLSNDGSLKDSVPIISMFALGLTRLLPSVNRIVTSYNQIIFHRNTLNTIYSEVQVEPERVCDHKIIEWNKLKFTNIQIASVSGKVLISNANFEIKKGQKIGIIGDSGSGKTTLIDVILGIHPISLGSIYCDEIAIDMKALAAFRSKANYIPQSVHLFKGTIEANIAMGNSINKDKISDAIARVNLTDLVSERSMGNFQIGESGIGVSGGQAQRIGIARALYVNADILIFDEPTSSLDEQSSIDIVQTIFEISEEKTIILVTHQPEILSRCDVIYKIQNNMLIRV